MPTSLPPKRRHCFVESIEAFRAWERTQMTTGMEELSRLQNELGLLE